MASFQQITVMGNLARDPELSYLQSGQALCKFAVAVNEKKGQKEHVEWFNVVVWEKTAENCSKYLSKGDSVLVTGKLETRRYKNKQGEDKQATDLKATNVTFVTTKRKEASPQQQDAPPPDFPDLGGPLDDIPF